MLFCLLLDIVVPGVGDLKLQLAFSILDIRDNSAVVSSAPAYGCAAGACQAQFSATVAFHCNVGWMPLVGPAKWGFIDLVVPLDSHNALYLDPFLPAARRVQ